MPTATDEPTEEAAPEDSADAPESLNGAGEPESPNGMHGGHDVTVAAEEEDPGPEIAEPEPEAEEPSASAASLFYPEPGPEPTTPAASFSTPDPEPTVPAASVFTSDLDPPAADPEPAAPASSIFVHDPGLPSTPPSMFTDDEEPPPLTDAPADVPREEPPARSDDPFGAYRFGPASEYDNQEGAGYTSGHESDYVPGYAAETGYNHGMTQPVEEEIAPPPALPADLPAAPGRGTGAKSAFASAYRALPRPKPRSKPRPRARPQPRSRGEVATARRANLVIARLEPWSVMKFSFLMSLVAWVVLFVAVALLYYALSSLGVFESIQKTLASVTSSTSSSGLNLAKWTSAPRILGYTMLIGAVDVILITALSTIGAMVYNLVTHLGGGIEVTLRETD
ncbi:MAG TPA: DUF3566 domain-containing protein [Streptosporangiaceae bacterium]